MFGDDNEKKDVMVSGGFDPVHIGHIRMILEASKHGDVIVVANSDAWLFSKKGFVLWSLTKSRNSCCHQGGYKGFRC